MKKYDSPSISFMICGDVIATSVPPVAANYEDVQDRISFDKFL